MSKVRTRPDIQAMIDANRNTLERMKRQHKLIRIKLPELRVGDEVLSLRRECFIRVVEIREPLNTPNGVLWRAICLHPDGRQRPFAGRTDLHAWVRR